jgi:hypothetical protein
MDVTTPRRKVLTKSNITSLGKRATEGYEPGDTLVFYVEKKVAPPPPPPVVTEPPPPPPGAVQPVFTCRMGVKMEPFFPATFPSWHLPPSSSTFRYDAWDQHPKWTALGFGLNYERSRLDIRDGQLVTTVADGGPDPERGSNYAALVLIPKATAPLEGAQHFSFRVDPHLSGRRWIEVLAYEAGTPLVNPNATRNFPQTHVTGQGQVVCWQIDADGHRLDVTVPGEPHGDYFREKVLESQCVQPNEIFLQPPVPLAARRHWDKAQWGNDLNGTQELLPALGGQPRRFDIWISRTHYRLEEGGQLIKQGEFAVPLRFERVQFALTHMVYHTGLEHQEIIDYNPAETYWRDVTPYHDTRFWDDFEWTAEPQMPA